MPCHVRLHAGLRASPRRGGTRDGPRAARVGVAARAVRGRLVLCEKPVAISVDGTLENLGAYTKLFHGTWPQGGQKGDFTVTRN